ncbi:hypothetical protein HAX54_050676, partial [Datura stramonium]|nr:hypothetical protein [Datura stramonium]
MSHIPGVPSAIKESGSINYVEFPYKSSAVTRPILKNFWMLTILKLFRQGTRWVQKGATSKVNVFKIDQGDSEILKDFIAKILERKDDGANGRSLKYRLATEKDIGKIEIQKQSSSTNKTLKTLKLPYNSAM